METIGIPSSAQVLIFDISSKLIYSNKSENLVLDISAFKANMYRIRILYENEIKVFSFEELEKRINQF